jgi:tetratricopeptide (TPR) repeat protein
MVEAARTGAWSYLQQGSTAEAQQGSTAEALRLAETGLSEADHDPDLLAAASKAAWMIGLLPLAIEHGRGWHAQAAAGGDPGAEAAALVHLARLHWEAKDFQRQWQTVWAALRVAEPLGESEPLARAYSLAAEAHMLNEQHAEAVRWADKALAMAEAVGCPAVRAAALVNKGTALADRVDGHDEGVALLERAVAEARPATSATSFTGPCTTCSSSRSTSGRPPPALASLRDARRSDLVPVEGWIDPCWIDLIEVALLLEAGRLDQAEALLRRHDDRTGAEGDPPGGRGRPGRRPGRLPAGARPPRALPGPVPAGRLPPGRRPLPARPWRRGGRHRPRPPGRPPARPLARLAPRRGRRPPRRGLSNGEIARRLYISTKTASVHVSNILAKLNMTSGTEVATWAVRTGLVPLG